MESVSICAILWNIFSYYSLQGNYKDPSRMSLTGLIKLCSDTMLMDPMMVTEPLSQANLHLIYTSVMNLSIKNAIKGQHKSINGKVEKSDKLEYDEFLSCVRRIAIKCYPNETKSVDESMQQLLMDNILPLAYRRVPVNIEQVLSQPAIIALHSYYKDSLMEVFRFFAMTSDFTLKSKNMTLTTSGVAGAAKTFDEQASIFELAKSKGKVQSASAHEAGYQDFVRFANDLGLFSNEVGLTKFDIGDIYMTVLSFSSNFTSTFRKISFDEFWECVVRCAMVAFKQYEYMKVEHMVKELFLHSLKHMQNMLKEKMSTYGTLLGGGFNSYKGDLLSATKSLQAKITNMWKSDEFVNYIEIDVDHDRGRMVEAFNTGTVPTWADVSPPSSRKSSLNHPVAHSTQSSATDSTRKKSLTRRVSTRKSALQPPDPPKGPSLLTKMLQEADRTGPEVVQARQVQATMDNLADSFMPKLSADSRDETPARSAASSFDSNDSSCTSRLSSASSGGTRSCTASESTAMDGPPQSSAALQRGSVPGSPDREVGSVHNSEEIGVLLHSAVGEKSSFVVTTTAEECLVRVQIQSDTMLDDGRILPSDLRKLLYLQPDIAMVLYDCMTEEGIGEIP